MNMRVIWNELSCEEVVFAMNIICNIRYCKQSISTYQYVPVYISFWTTNQIKLTRNVSIGFFFLLTLCENCLNVLAVALGKCSARKPLQDVLKSKLPTF